MSKPIKDFDIELEQKRIDMIQFWLRNQTEPFDDWEWDDEEEVLKIFTDNFNDVEVYPLEQVKQFIEGFE